MMDAHSCIVRDVIRADAQLIVVIACIAGATNLGMQCENSSMMKSLLTACCVIEFLGA
eukprot:CAMPEP_0202898402 /NCGR_PEP_ID=MMETSP1392-20130828/6939_1 /ASSEMBLY_ACC=CAM_ASM_000868 /TAXON_ID=225041 /ORGANISM="Chlamydomonas chlamydogama, Strain SAG 11-48b" /LENGTH=57 /DNA_ID=CAMNT_0049584321 /DNA_START=242 /DNA_END=415 /DNA_ORIENTATION=+